MKKSISLTLASVLLLGTIFTVANAYSETSKWTFVSEDYYRMLHVDIENPVLLNRLQDRDLAGIQAALVDEKAEPMTKQAVDELKADPNATAVDNLLPDGRFLKDNWAELKNTMIESAMKVKSLHNNQTIAEVEAQEFEANIETGNGNVVLKMQKLLQTDGKTITIPKNPDGLSVQFTITPDGQKSLVSANNGLWVVDNSKNQFQQISSKSFNGKTYEELEKESMDLFGENIVIWNDAVTPSSDSTKLVYVSTKNNLDGSSSALFAYDFATGVETLIAEEEGAGYLVDGWLNSKSILCKKFTSNGMTQVVVGLDGSEYELKLAGESAYVYAVQDDLIAYATSMGSGEIHIVRIGESGTLQEISSLQMKGTTRIRSGQGFSHNNSYVAFIYVPDDNPNARFLKVVDLKNNKVIDIDALPDSTNSSASILEFSWVDDKTLLIVVVEDEAGVNKQSTWTYSLDRGE